MPKSKTNRLTARRRRSASRATGQTGKSGKLKIGDDWNAIRIIALSQSNPLKAIAEFVENSIDANAKRITITRFRQNRQAYIRIIDDGDGVAPDERGKPNFGYVATHICDSIKRQIKARGQSGVQGEFGIGLLSFWTVGKTLSMICPGADGKAYEMQMVRGDPSYSLSNRRLLIADHGTQLTVGPLLSGIRNMSGEKLQWYLAGELRDRIRKSGVEIRIVDRLARAEFAVEPREFDGQLLHHLPAPQPTHGEVHVEIYLSEPQPNRVPSLYRAGTRVLAQVTELDLFQRPPWNSGYFEGVINAPFLNLTPGTRLGVVYDERLQDLVNSLAELEATLDEIVEQQKRMASEKANRDTLKAIQKAFREALLILPEEEYDWFDIYNLDKSRPARHQRRRLNVPPTNGDNRSESNAESADLVREPMYLDNDSQTLSEQDAERDQAEQQSFYQHPGPLYSARIAPTTCTMSVGSTRNFQAVARDQRRRLITDDLRYRWHIVEGHAELDATDRATVKLTAPAEPQLLRLSLEVIQSDPRAVEFQSEVGDPLAKDAAQSVLAAAATDAAGRDAARADGSRTAQAEAIITVTDSLLPQSANSTPRRGLPEYTFEKQPGQLWRSRFEADTNLIVINSGHRDFVYAARSKALKLRYICRLFGKELVLQNFPGVSAEQLLERLIELGLYTEENLR